MQQNSILLQDLSLEQLTKLITSIVKTETDDLKKHFQPKEPTVYLTRQEVAFLLSVDISSVHNYTKRGVLKSYGIQGRVYYKRSEVEASLKPLNS